MTDHVDHEAPVADSEAKPQAASVTSAPTAELPPPAEVAPADTGSAEVAPADTGSAEAASAEAASAEAASAEAASAEAASAEAANGEAGPDGSGRKRKRRRRKKKAALAEGDEGNKPPKASKPKRDLLPFQRFFSSGLRRQAFSVGEAVAGVTTHVGDNCASIDLFGKATAFARQFEPRDIPVVEIPMGAPATAADVAAADVAAADVAAADVAAADVAAADVAAADVAAAETDSAVSAKVVKAAKPLPKLSYVVHPDGTDPLEEGKIFRGRIGAIAESGHLAIVNEIVNKAATRRVLARARDDRSRVDGLVFGYNRGGFDVLVYGMRAFCPVGGLTLGSVEDPASSLGHWAEFHVQTVKSGSQGLVVSRRSILEREARKAARAFLKSLKPGQKLKGRVTQVRDYGMFVDIGGAEGLVHQSEISYDRSVRPADVAKPGDEIDVQVLSVQGADRKKKERFDRVSLSIKALLPDPFDAHAEELAEGSVRKGKVVRTAEFGAFIQLVPGIDGLLHVSELGKGLKHAGDAIKVGEEVHVVIERVDKKAHRIGLSKLTDAEVELFEKGELDTATRPAKLKSGAHITVTVTKVNPAGLEVKLDNVVGKRGRGFIPNSEMGTPRGTDHRKKWGQGTQIEVKIIGNDRDGGLRCSRKRLLQDEERRAIRDYRKEVAQQGLGTFGDILRSKLGLDK